MPRALLILLSMSLGALCAPLIAADAAPDPSGVSQDQAPPATSTAGNTSPRTTRYEMKHVDFHLDESIIMEIRTMRGQLRSLKKGSPPTFDDKKTLLLEVDSGEVALKPEALSGLMNRFVFNYPGSPLSEIQVGIEGEDLKLEARLHKGAVVPVEMLGAISPIPDGRIRFYPKKIKAAGVGVGKLMDALGLEVQKVIKTNEARGIEVVGDELYLDPNKMVPAPRIQGRVSAVRIEGDRLVISFGPKNAQEASTPLKPSDPSATNYMLFRGGTIRFGKLTMNNADLQIVDENPEDPLDFFIDHYIEQLVAGKSKTMPDLGLIAYMPDYHRLKSTNSGASSGTSSGAPPATGTKTGSGASQTPNPVDSGGVPPAATKKE